MAEEEEKREDRRLKATADSLARLVTDTIEVDIETPSGDLMTFEIRPITWAEDELIDAAVASIKDEGKRARERMRTMVWKALVRPEMKKKDFDTWPVGLVIRLAREIRKISDYTVKNWSESS